jgi:hypothetical protein
MAESESVSEINLSRVERAENYPGQKIFRAQRRQFHVERKHHSLLYSQSFHAIDFLLKGLKQRRRGFRVQDCSRVRIECDHSRAETCFSRPLDDSLHYELMAEVQSVEDAEGKRGGRRDFTVGL